MKTLIQLLQKHLTKEEADAVINYLCLEDRGEEELDISELIEELKSCMSDELHDEVNEYNVAKMIEDKYILVQAIKKLEKLF